MAFELVGARVLLRDFLARDIEDYLRWKTEETTWQLWDAPWEYEGASPLDAAACAAARERMEARTAEIAQLDDGALRSEMEICLRAAEGDGEGAHIGGIATYRMNDAFEIADEGPLLALGIDINEPAAWGRGYATEALKLAIAYYQQRGWPELYMQTWSGNVRMIRVAEKLGFRECYRKWGIRHVRGGVYDGLTFRLDV